MTEIGKAEVTFHQISEIEDSLIKYAVIAARYQDKWVFCRHKSRSSWEIPGGRRETFGGTIGAGGKAFEKPIAETASRAVLESIEETALGAALEPIEATARRELWEETGALETEICPICVYDVRQEEGTHSYGMLFWANITELGDLPEEFEIAEIQLADLLPKELAYPDIQPALFERTQGWLNLKNGAGELWDVYDADRNLTGRFHHRGEPLSEGDYHMVIHVWIQNSQGDFLITKRSPNKGFPNMWECTGGSALAGDDSLAAALREVQEETGLTLQPENGQVIISGTGTDYFYDIWLFKQDFALSEVVLLEGETCDASSASAEEILQMHREGTFVPYEYLEEMFDNIV